MSPRDYWLECVSIALEEAGVSATEEQLQQIAEAVEGCHENYGMSFYSPPTSDRIAVLERESAARYSNLRSEYDAYRRNAEIAVGRALRQPSDASLTIGENGEVIRHDGRMVVLQ